MEQEAGIDLGGEFPVVVPYFMKELIEEISRAARKSKYVDQQSGVSARLQHRQLPHDGRLGPAAGGACSASSRPCRGSATWATSTRRRSASWSST